LEKLKLSNYIVESHRRNGSVLLFSTITKAVLELSADEYSRLISGSTEGLSGEEISGLIESGFLVSKATEANRLKHYFNVIRLRPDTFSTYIAFSLDCNFGCVYCYQGSQKHMTSSRINKEDMPNIIRWYKRIVGSKKYRKLQITFFGGEPLLHTDLIELFVERLEAETAESDILITYKIVTNGYLLSAQNIALLTKIKMIEVQVTIDGLADTHNKKRPLLDGGGTYEQIVRNLVLCEEAGLDLLIRVSLDKTNINEITSLLNEFRIAGLISPTIYLAPIHQTVEQKDNASSFCSSNIVGSVSELVRLNKAFYSSLKEYGYPLPTYCTNGPCMMYYADSCLLSHNGELYKCVEMMGDTNLCVGRYSNSDYNSFYYKIMSESPWEACINEGCKYVPLCAGGCAMQSYLKTGDYRIRDCHKAYFDEMLLFLLNLKYN